MLGLTGYYSKSLIFWGLSKVTPQGLKNSILQLAIQGKLVDQRPEEGNADELYQQIQAEKQRLIKMGKIRKQKQLPGIAESDIPYDIPYSWKWVRLQDVTYGVGNKNNKILQREVKPKGKFPAIGQGAKLISGYSDLEDKLVNDLPLVMFGDHTRNVKYIDFPFVISADGTKFMKAIGINAKYLFYWMAFAATQLRNRGYARHFTLLVKEPVPLPCKGEQKRIVARIEELLPYIDRYGQVWNELQVFNKKFPEDLQKSILQLAIKGKLVDHRPEEGSADELYRKIQVEKQRLIKKGKIKKQKPSIEIMEDKMPFELPGNWKWVSIDGVCINLQYGTSQKSSEVGKIAVLRMGNIQNGVITYDSLVYSSSDSDIEKYSLNRNDLLFNRTNSKDLVGKTAIYKGDIPAIYASYLIRITPVLLDSEYLNYVMQSHFFWTYCQAVRSDAIGQSNINAQKLKRFVFPLPPLGEQKRIVAKIEELLSLCEKLI